MSRYIDAEKLGDAFDEQMHYLRTMVDPRKTVVSRNPLIAGINWCRNTLNEQPAADVVSREQYNACYDQCLRLRSENEQLLDSLRACEDDRK